MSSGANFNASYSRRPTGQPPAPPKLSLLGEPPISRNPSRTQQQGQGKSYGNYGYDAGAEYGNDNNFEEEYETMMNEFNDYHRKVEPAGSDNQYERVDRGGRWGQNAPRRQQDYNRGGDSEARHRAPSWKTGSDANPRNYGEQSRPTNPGPGNFNQQQNFGQNVSQQFPNQGQQNFQGLGLNQMAGQQQNQQLLNLQSGLMGMMPMNPAQNALNLLQQQQLAAAAATANPMQLLLGNLPAFNTEVLGKQILNAAAAAASASGANSFGQNLGVGNRSMPQPLMGIDSFDNRSFDRNASNRSRLRPRSPNSVRRDLNRSRDAGRVERKRPGDRYDDANNKRFRGRDDDKNRVPRISIGSPARDRDGNRTGRKSDFGKKKADKDKQEGAKDETKDEEKDTEKEKNVQEKDEIKKEPQEGEVAEEGTENKPEEAKDKEKGKKKEEKHKSKYDDIPTSLLVCKVCQKSMNDSASFESHLHGRAHMLLLDILKQRFLKRADLLMAESKLSEEEIGIEMDRQKRAGKGGGGGGKGKNFCKMCDCNYAVSWGAHKSGIHHRILKEFLHPNCRVCDAQFVHRMDWVNHIVGTSHLKKLAELKAAGKNLEDHESTTQGELFSLSIEIGQDEHPSNCITVRNLDWKIPLKDDLKALLRDDMDVPEGEIIIPQKYDETVAVGEEAIITTVGYCCKVCKIYMTRESDIESHLKDKSHFGMYTNFLKKVVKYREELQRQEEAKAKGEPEVLDVMKEIQERNNESDNATDGNEKKEVSSKTENTNANDDEIKKEEEQMEVQNEDELLKDESMDENAGAENQALKIDLYTLDGENVQKMDTEDKIDARDTGSEQVATSGDSPKTEQVNDVNREDIQAVGGDKSPTKSDPAPAPVTLKPVVKAAHASATPTSRNKPVRGGRGRGTPSRGSATPARGTAIRGAANVGMRGGRGARGAFGARGTPAGAARGFPKADR